LHSSEPATAAAFELVIDTVFVPSHVREFGSETLSSALGVMWLHALPGWRDGDICELLIHELTHTLLFIDERRYGHYRDTKAMMASENHVASAIRTEPRPLYASLHSVVVACELLAWRQRVGDATAVDPKAHPPSALLRSNVRSALESIFALGRLEDLATPRACELLAACHALVAVPAEARA
jgi:hypothetical protein